MVSPIINMPNTTKHSGVSGLPTQLLVLHSGESPLRGGYAQSLTNWANTTAVQASWHWFVDPIAIVAMVHPNYAAWHASEANPMSEGFEQSGYARFSRAEWLTAEGLKQVDNLAWLMAQRAKANGIPMRWLTTAQVTAITSGRDRKTKGFCTHRQIDPETRYDPGDGYPFDILTAKINSYLGSNPTNTGGLTVADINSISAQLAELLERTKPINTSNGAESIRDFIAAGTRAAQEAAANTAPINVSGGRQEGIRDFIAKGTRAAERAEAKLDSIVKETETLRSAVADIVSKGGLTSEEIIAAVKAGIEDGRVTVDINVKGPAPTE